MTDPLLRTQSFTYDAAGRVETQTLTDGNVVSYTYDASGNVESVTPPGRPTHSFSYTPVDLTASYAPPSLMSVPSPQTSYEYDVEKAPTFVHRPDGTSVAFTYETAPNTGRLKTTTYPVEAGAPSAGTVTLTNAYHPTSGNLSSVTSSEGEALGFTYDGSLLLSVTASGSAAGTVSATYNTDFRPATQTVLGHTVSFGYDDDGLPTAVGALGITRDTQNGLVTGTTLDTITDTRTYTTFGELEDFVTKRSTATLLSLHHERDAVGRIELRDELIQGEATTYEYSYDSAGRLWQVFKNGDTAPAATYTYDSNGNRLSRATPEGTESATYDDQDRLLTYGTWSYTYTANGELKTKTNTATSEVTTYTYDGMGALRRVDLPDGRVVEYAVDPMGRRIQKKVDGVVTRKWLYGADPLHPVAELDGSDTVISRFVGQDYLVRGGTTYRLVKDHLGSVRLVVNAATGIVAQRMDFDEYGRVVSDTAPGWQPLGYAGGIWDPDTGLVRFGARDYDPEAGRWTTIEPVLFLSGSSNFYAYVLGDPINTQDEDGEKPQLNLHGPKDKNFQATEKITPQNYTVSAHGNDKFVLDRNGKVMTPEKLAEMIKADPAYTPGAPVDLLACEAGKGRNPLGVTPALT